MITVSETAKNQLVILMQQENLGENRFVRVSVKGGGCSGLKYDLKFETEIKPEDQVFVDKGIKIVVDKKSFLYVVGTELNYSGGLNGTGFSFHNPNATRTCGCGESFAV